MRVYYCSEPGAEGPGEAGTGDRGGCGCPCERCTGLSGPGSTRAAASLHQLKSLLLKVSHCMRAFLMSIPASILLTGNTW